MPDRTPAPVRLKEKVLQQIASEPARVETDSQGRLVAINPAFTVLCGYTFPEVEGRKPGSFLQGAESEPEAVQTLRDAVQNGRPCETSLVNYHKDGHAYRVHVQIEPIRDPEGLLKGFRAVEVEVPMVS
jgi:PAS domain S-box-containing protein